MDLSVLPKKFIRLLPKIPKDSQGKVVTRFPPAPSGYLHLGHLKALLLNYALASKYDGRMLLRIDNTNPELDSAEYEKGIIEDLGAIGLDTSQVNHSSDHFPIILRMAEKMIVDGLAYVDSTPADEMKEMRANCEAAPFRNEDVDFHLKRWHEMCAGKLTDHCLRLKISLDDPNFVMRDPVIYRHIDNKGLFPTYDFTCPLVDSFEGVTHALRTSEYDSRDGLYHWILEKCGLPPINLIEFSRLTIENVILSKRKLKKLVDEGVVSGWDDPRMPTLRGLMKRGVTVTAMMRYVADQGLTKKTGVVTLDKLWSYNKQELDLIVPRYTCLDANQLVVLSLSELKRDQLIVDDIPLHRKVPELGTKSLGITFAGDQIDLYLEHEDALWLNKGEEITLLYWGNVIITEIIEKNENQIVKVKAIHHPEGDPKNTNLKLTWLPTERYCNLLQGVIHSYDSLVDGGSITKTQIIMEPGLSVTKDGDQIQFQRKGFYKKMGNIWNEHLYFPRKAAPIKED